MTSDVVLDEPVRGVALRGRHSASDPARRQRRRFVVGIAGIAALATIIRVLNVLWWRPTRGGGTDGFVLGGDSFYYHWQANALAAGEWFVDPFRWANDGAAIASSAHPPLYPLYLSVWSRVGVDSVTGHRLVSGLLGVAAVVVIGLLVRRMALSAAGFAAAALAAFYPQLWINDGMVMSESLVVLVTALALYAAYSYVASPTLRAAVVLGVACGAATLTRSELALLFPVVVIPLALRVPDRRWRERARHAVAACLAGIALVGPWATFNMLRFAEPTLLSTGIGSALSAASCDEVYFGSKIGYWAYCFDGPWPPASVDESERDLAPRDDAVDYLKDNLGRLPVVAAARVGRMWGVFKPGQTTTFEWELEARGRVASWVALVYYYTLVPFAVVGLVGLHRRRVTIWPLVALLVIATFAAAITFGVTRYRAPAEVALVVAAAVGAVTAWRSLVRRDVDTAREASAP